MKGPKKEKSFNSVAQSLGWMALLVLISLGLSCGSKFDPLYLPGLTLVAATPTSIPNTCSTSGTPFGGGSGTVGDPYQVCSRAHLVAIAGVYEDKYFIQKMDINLGGSATPFTPISTGSYFAGVYDGNGFTISGFYYRNVGGGSRMGLFSNIGTVALGGTVKNLTISGADIDTEEAEAGVLVGLSAHAIIQNCHVSGTISGDAYVGGLIGKADLTTVITSSTANVTVTATDVQGSGMPYVGGMVGSLDATSSISKSYALGAVTGLYSGSGGLAGYSDGTISNSYARGSVTAGSEAGGLVGDSGGSTISKSYSTGAVTAGAGNGGLIGLNSAGTTLSNSYWDMTTSGHATSALGTGLTTAQMKDYNNFATWDFATIWNGAAYSGSGSIYPFLR